MSLYDCVSASWPAWLDGHTAVRWLITVLYICAAVLSLEVARRSRRSPENAWSRQQARFWLIIAFALLVLGINKQVDIQSVATETGRCIAHVHGWYLGRVPFQELLVVAVLLMAFAGLLLTVWLFRNVLGQNILAVIGLIFVATFLVLRTASFRDLDQLIGIQVIGTRVSWLFELAGIACISVNGVRIVRSKSNKRSQELGSDTMPK